jgi:hypothetical protein
MSLSGVGGVGGFSTLLVAGCSRAVFFAEVAQCLSRECVVWEAPEGVALASRPSIGSPRLCSGWAGQVRGGGGLKKTKKRCYFLCLCAS